MKNIKFFNDEYFLNLFAFENICFLKIFVTDRRGVVPSLAKNN